jgi:hypothetical protein
MRTTTIPTYMQPQWFLPLFAVMWLGINALLSVLGAGASAQQPNAPPIVGLMSFVAGTAPSQPHRLASLATRHQTLQDRRTR